MGKREIIYLSPHCHRQNVVGWLAGWLLRENGARLTSTETIRLIRDGGGGGGENVDVGEEGYYISIAYTVTTRMTSALKWAAMRAILMFH